MRRVTRTTLTFLVVAAILSPPGFAADDLEDAIAALRRGDTSRAEASLGVYLESHPDLARGHRLLGISRLLLGKYEYARRSLETAIELGDRSFLVARALAQVDLGQKRVFDAIERLSAIDGNELNRNQKEDWGELLLRAVSIEHHASRHERAYRAALRVHAIPQVPAEARLEAQILAAGSALELAESVEPPEELWLTRARELARGRFHRDRIYHRQSVALLHEIAGRANRSLGDTERACRDFESALELASTPQRAVRVARCRSTLGDWHAVHAAAETGLAGMRADVVLGSCLVGRRNRFKELHRHHSRALDQLGESEHESGAATDVRELAR